MLDKRGRHHDAALLVQLRLRRTREHEAVHLAGLTAERVEALEPGSDELVPPLAREDGQAVIHAPRDDDPSAERLAELGREGEPVLVIEGVLVFAE